VPGPKNPFATEVTEVTEVTEKCTKDKERYWGKNTCEKRGTKLSALQFPLSPVQNVFAFLCDLCGKYSLGKKLMIDEGIRVESASK
jgi:hypothetical protein